MPQWMLVLPQAPAPLAGLVPRRLPGPALAVLVLRVGREVLAARAAVLPAGPALASPAQRRLAPPLGRPVQRPPGRRAKGHPGYPGGPLSLRPRRVRRLPCLRRLGQLLGLLRP